MPIAKKLRSGKRAAHRQKVSFVGFATLPDDILLEIFDFYLAISYQRIDGHNDAWHMLTHVCRRWRCIVFASPRRLRLRLLCTGKRPVQEMLDVWPAFPIVIRGRREMWMPQDANNIVAALKQHIRVCEIDIEDDHLHKFWKKMEDPFLVLTSLRMRSLHIRNDAAAPVLHDTFLGGGSAPRLQALELSGIPFPALPKLLLSTPGLVKLELWDIPLPGYITPEAMVICLSTLSRLETLRLEFRFPRSRADRESRLPPRLTRLVLPRLTKFYFAGDTAYLEDIVAQINTPLLDELHMRFFNQLIFDTPLLHHFISRTEAFKSPHRAYVEFGSGTEFRLFWKDKTKHHSPLSWQIICKPLDWRLSSLAQLCESAFSPFPTIERLEIYSRDFWKDDEVENTQWLEVLHPFTSVKDLVLRQQSIQLIAPTLEEISGEGVTTVLPALQNIFIAESQPLKPVKKMIGKFIAARQLAGFPVAVHRRWAKEWKGWRML